MIDLIVTQIVEFSLEYDTNDEVRNLYSALMDVSIGIGKVMEQIREQERRMQDDIYER